MGNFSALKRQAELILEKLEGKRYVLADLNQRLQTTAEDFPQDTVIQAVARVVDKMTEKEPNAIISQAQFEQIYNELVGLNISGTKFREVLGEFLLSEQKTQEINNDYIKTNRDSTDAQLQWEVDNQIKEGFDKLFEEKSDKYNPNNAARAKEKVGLELRSLGFGKPKIILAGGNSRHLVFSADLDTNRGAVRVFVPTEASGDKLPSIFIGGTKIKPLTASSLNNHLANAMDSDEGLSNVSAILQTLDILTHNVTPTMEKEDFDKIASNVPENNGSEGLSAPGTFASLPDPKNNIKEIEVPKTPMPENLKALANDMEERVIETAIGYPQDSIQLAKKIILAELDSMGFTGSQIKINCTTENGFICSAILNAPQGKVAIEVPIEMKNNSPLMPSVFAQNDFVADFTEDNLKSFISSASTTTKGYVNRESQLYGMDLSELKDLIIKSASKGDFDTCDQAMEVISERVDEDSYKQIVSDYMRILSNVDAATQQLKQSFEDSDQFVKTPTSLYPIHKRLGLPAHKLIRDAEGNYHRKDSYYAREEQDGAFFSNAKILVGE